MGELPSRGSRGPRRLFTAIAALGAAGRERRGGDPRAPCRSAEACALSRRAPIGGRRGARWARGWMAGSPHRSSGTGAPRTRSSRIQPRGLGLLIALASHAGHRELVVGTIPSEGHVGITISVLERFGAVVTQSAVHGGGPGGDATRFTIRGPLRAPTAPVRVEADASSAAVALAAGALSGGLLDVVRGVGLDSSQPDAAFPSLMTRLGCDMSLSSGEQLALSGAPSNGGSLDAALFPTWLPSWRRWRISRGARGSPGTHGTETLPGKESSRIDVLAGGLRAIGFEVDATDCSLEGPPQASRPTRGSPRSEGDHRMAFAFALMSLLRAPASGSSIPGAFPSRGPLLARPFRLWRVTHRRSGGLQSLRSRP